MHYGGRPDVPVKRVVFKCTLVMRTHASLWSEVVRDGAHATLRLSIHGSPHGVTLWPPSGRLCRSPTCKLPVVANMTDPCKGLSSELISEMPDTLRVDYMLIRPLPSPILRVPWRLCVLCLAMVEPAAPWEPAENMCQCGRHVCVYHWHSSENDEGSCCYACAVRRLGRRRRKQPALR